MIKRLLQKKIKNTNIIKFKQAFHPNFVHSYKILFKDINGEEYSYLYFSDFYLMPSDRKKIISFGLNNNFNGKFKVKIYAIESFGKESENYIEDNINIQ